jgi:hypothetical protein
MKTLLRANPNWQLSGPLPHLCVQHFITGTKSPREAWVVVGHAINVSGNKGNCKILFDSLRLACAPNEAGVTLSPLAGVELTTPVPNAALILHRTALMNVKLPRSNQVLMLQAGTKIVAAIGGLSLNSTRHARTP